MDEVQLPQVYRATQGGNLLFTTQVLEIPGTAIIWSTSEGWKAESTLELPSGFEHETTGFGIQHLWIYREAFHRYSLYFFIENILVAQGILNEIWVNIGKNGAQLHKILQKF